MDLSPSNERYLVITIVVMALAMRLLPHPDNITPLGAAALFSGAYLSRRIFWAVPLVVLLVSDLFLGLYHVAVMVAVYSGFLVQAVIGRTLLMERTNAPRIVFGVGLGALAFWLISNFGVWFAFHPLTLDELLVCYAKALPFLGRSMAGDAIYSLLLFSAYPLLRYLLVAANANKN